jgi:hypothetical protein
MYLEQTNCPTNISISGNSNSQKMVNCVELSVSPFSDSDSVHTFYGVSCSDDVVVLKIHCFRQ